MWLGLQVIGIHTSCYSLCCSASKSHRGSLLHPRRHWPDCPTPDLLGTLRIICWGYELEKTASEFAIWILGGKFLFARMLPCMLVNLYVCLKCFAYVIQPVFLNNLVTGLVVGVSVTWELSWSSMGRIPQNPSVELSLDTSMNSKLLQTRLLLESLVLCSLILLLCF